MPSQQTLGAISAALILLQGACGAAAAHEYKVGSLRIEHPWSRATAGGATVAAGYLIIDNAADTPDRLVLTTAEVAAKVSAHSMTMDGTVMKMRALPDGVVIPPKSSVVLKPGSIHLMFEGLKHPLKRGESLLGTLTFEKAGTVAVTFKVEAIGTTNPKGGMDGMKMD